MAYCRGNSLIGKDASDVYVYAGIDGGFTVHVATDVGVPAAGQTFVLRTLEELKDKLGELHKNGVAVPNSVFTRIDQEILELENGR